jgi:AcrR family transcriptional regulator
VNASATRAVRSDSVRNQQLIVNAAREVLSECGTDARMDTIATRAGVGIGTVYRHFPNKQALVDELVRLILDDLVDAGESALARDDGTGLEAFLRALGYSLAEHHAYADKLIESHRCAGAEQLRALMAQLLDQAQRYGRISPDVTHGDILATAWALRGIVETSGTTAPNAWQRHLEIHLAGLCSGLS